jgi:chemotaxis methyl-accepting protein methylase
MYLRLNRRIWNRLPSKFLNSGFMFSYGTFLQNIVHRRSNRRQHFATFFLRNRPQLELMRRMVELNPRGSDLRIAVIGCSIGAEVYSILWTLRSARPDLKVQLCAVDISAEVLNIAREGIYTSQTSDFLWNTSQTSDFAETSIFERMTENELGEMFDWKGTEARVKSWIREGVRWQVADAGDPELIDTIGPQDIVVASNFLCHMQPPDADRCLRNIAGLAKPGGYLFVSGLDLDVRTEVAGDLGWRPVPELIEEIHDADPSLRDQWPWEWWGLEPFNKRKCNWQLRYAAVFQTGDRVSGEAEVNERRPTPGPPVAGNP